MSLVEQIEVVRGPSSALYGTNGIFATVNIITKTPGNAAQTSVATELGSFGRQKVTASSAFGLGKEAKVLVSGTLSHAGGRTVAFPELANAGSSSRTDNSGAETGYHLFADLTWRNWTVTALFGQHKYIIPTGWYGTIFGDTGTTDLDARNFVEAAWNRPVGKSRRDPLADVLRSVSVRRRISSLDIAISTARLATGWAASSFIKSKPAASER